MKHVEKYITRKSLIYKTEVEYGDYTLNHIQGCAHGCTFPCYAYMMAKRFGKVKCYNEWIQPALVANAKELLQFELPKYQDKIDILHLCFTTDPFMYGYEDIKQESLQILKICNDYGVKCSVLTKGILPIELGRLSEKNEYGITLVSLDEKFHEKYEPYTANYEERIQALEKLHKEGFYTWVSMEPYPTPNIVEQDIEFILSKIRFVDKIIFGRLNYNKLVSEYKEYKSFYKLCTKQVIDFCNYNKISYHIKKGTIDNSLE